MTKLTPTELADWVDRQERFAQDTDEEHPLRLTVGNEWIR